MKIPTQWGICMEGNAQPIAEALDLLIRRRPAKEKRPFTYLEIGVAEGGTMAAVVELLKQYDGLNWSVTGLDIPEGWSFNEAALKRNVNGVRFPTACQLIPNSASVYLVPSHKFLTEMWDWPVDFAFVDGCHGKSCVKGDFIGLARHIRRGGIVCFHDASPKCQGYHPQPHCGTGIAVREALQELGLLEDRLPCWRRWREVDADHGCAFFQFVGYDKLTIPTVPLPKESQVDPLLGTPGWTRAEEVKFIRWLAKQTTGNILEVGCNDGQTTLELASALPNATAYACDCTGPGTMSQEQQAEKPNPQTICQRARHLPNVNVLDCPSAEIDYKKLGDISLVFIDGDHSYQGVKADTEKALDYFAASKAKGKRFIVWHDVYEDAPSWVGVLSYLNREILPFFDVQRMAGTWLACLGI